MVIEGQRKRDAGREQDGEHGAVSQIREQQTCEVCEENKHFGGYHVGHNRADKESFFAFEDDAAG